MALTLNGSTGLSGIVGSAGTPALQGTDTNTGYFFGTDILGLSTGGNERLRIDSAGLVSIPIAGNLQVGAAGSGETDTKVYVANTGGNAYIQLKGADSNGTVGLKFGRNSVANRAGIDWGAATDALIFRTGGTEERLRITSGGFSHIGLPTISNSWDTHAIALPTNSATFACPATVSILGGTGFATANMAGGGIRFVGYYDANNYTTFAHVAGVKENTVSGEYGGALTFHVRQNNGLGEEAARFTSAGDLKFPNGHGIDFSAQTSTPQSGASADNERFDHYEEGDWTPEPTITHQGGTGALSAIQDQFGRYVRSGNFVQIWFYFKFTAANITNCNVGVNGLPFTISNDGQWNSGFNGGIARRGVTGGETYICEGMGKNSTQIGVLRKYDNTGFGNTTQSIGGTACYLVD